MTVSTTQTLTELTFNDQLTGAFIGSERWWREVATIGTPLQETQDDGQVRLDFLHRGAPETARVLIDVNGVTDHHSAHPAELEHLEGTDVWWWSAAVRLDHRGSYCFIPLTDPAQGDPPRQDAPDRGVDHRRWWVSMLKQSVADAFNPYPSLCSSWDTPASAIHLADAPPQPAWSTVDRQAPDPTPDRGPLSWTSPTLGNSRRVWIHQVGTPDDDQPLVVLLDGQHWFERLSLPRALDAAHTLGLPSCLTIMIDSVDNETRARELPCHEPFWHAVVDELLPLVRQQGSCTDDPARTIVAGQSYGGLAALYAGLTHPERFGVVLSQSGSYWWPHFARASADGPADPSQGWLTRQVRGGLAGDVRLRIHQEVGRLEGDMNLFNEEMRSALEDTGHDVTYTVFEGGHEWLCWRGGLIDGLTCLLGPERQPHTARHTTGHTGGQMTATDVQARKGWQGLVLKALPADDFVLTVVDAEDITPHFRRVHLKAGGLLDHITPHPTLWIRLWFAGGDRIHQRGYTIVNPDAENDTFDIDFAIHPGRAADWAREAQPGDTIEATVMGSSFALPQPPPRSYVIVGDTASLPAINTLLTAIGDVPARVWLEHVHHDDLTLPLLAQPSHHVTWVLRGNDGQDLVDRVTNDLGDEPLRDCFCWVACDTVTTRTLSRLLRQRHGVAKAAMKVQAYWLPPKH